MASFPQVLNGSCVYGLGTKMPLPQAGFITLSVLMALASITSVVLNATVIAATFRHKQLRQLLNFALVNLAVANLGTTLTGGLPSVVTNAVGYYIMGRVGCVMEGFCVALFAKVGGAAAARAESKVTWMVVMMVLAFLVSWLPYAALALTVVFNPEVQMSSLVTVVSIYMAKSSTVYNPMIYIFMNKQFQRYAVPLLMCGKDPWPSEDDASELQTVVSPVNKISPE